MLYYKFKCEDKYMTNTTLCYIEANDSYLMMLRNKKKVDLNKGKWIGVGGHFEEGESPDECLLREVYEETGLTLTEYKLRGIITFISDEWDSEYMFLYTASSFTGELIECNEGHLEWIPKKNILSLNLWEGDKAFLKKLFNEDDFFTMKLVYEGDKLVEIK